MKENAEKAVREAIQSWDPQCLVVAVSPMTPDASLRRYFRATLSPKAGKPETIVAMYFDSVASPEAGGASSITSDAAYVLLTDFFENAGIRVPALYFDGRDRSVLLLEDIGDTLLADAVLGEAAMSYAAGEVEALYQRAIDQIAQMQHIPRRPDFFAFQRAFGAQTYIREMEELRDFTLKSHNLPPAAIAPLDRCFADIAARLIALPQVLCHRDFHPWNIMVREREVVLIDFQDALLATACYDVVALLNDRDGDAVLGSERYLRLVDYAESALTIERDTFREQFALVLLQRDLKVAGRFEKLATLRNLQQYRRWIPGTLSRIGRSLRYLIGRYEYPALYSDVLSLLENTLEPVLADKRLLFT